MPPQMGSNHGACDVMSPSQMRTSRRPSTALQADSASKRAAATKAVASPAAGTAGKTKRLSRSRRAAATATATTKTAGHNVLPAASSSSSSVLAQADGHDDNAEMRSRLTAMQARYGAELHFLVTEFTKMEAQLSMEVTTAPDGGGVGRAVGETCPEQQLGRLRFFIEHVKRTTDRMEQAKGGLHHYTPQQLDMLEDHIIQRLLPVKGRMLVQLAQRSSSSATATAPDPTPPNKTTPSSPPTAGGGGLFLGDVGGKDDATAVSDGWVVGSPTPTPPSDGTGTSARPTMGLSSSSGSLVGSLSGMTTSASSSSASLPLARPCSSLSLADLGDLRGDQDGEDHCCGGVFLVGGEDCDDVNGSGIGLDLYDLGQEVKYSFLPGGDSRNGRWKSISTMSSTSSTTDGELSDDSLSVEADSTSYSFSSSSPSSPAAGGEAAASNPPARAESLLSLTPVRVSAAAGGRSSSAEGADHGGVSGPSAVKSGIDKEMGELSELFAPDAFLLSTVLDTEMEATAAAAEDLAKGAAAAAAAAAAVKTEYQPTSAAATLPSSSSFPGAPMASGLQVSSAMTPPPAAPTTVAPAPTPATVTPMEECRCGEAACPSLVTAARKRSMLEISSSVGSGRNAVGGVGTALPGSGPVSMVTGMPLATGLHQSSRQRKRQRSLAPVLSAPRTVSYECSLCKESYPSEIASNPWWSLFLHECPRCHRMQIPRVDAASAAVSVDYIHAVCAEEGEGCDSDGYGSDSYSDSDDDGPDDPGRGGIAAFDTDIIAGDSQAGCKEGRLSTFQASRLLVLMSHARTCPGRHANPQHAEVCRSTKFLMLHMRDCTGHGPNGDPCEHRWCRPCKSLLSHLVRCPDPNTCRICTPLDLPGPLRELRELNVAQAKQAAAAAAASSASATASMGGLPPAGSFASSLGPAHAAAAGQAVGASSTAASSTMVLDTMGSNRVVKAEMLSAASSPGFLSAAPPAAAAMTSFQQQQQQQIGQGAVVGGGGFAR